MMANIIIFVIIAVAIVGLITYTYTNALSAMRSITITTIQPLPSTYVVAISTSRSTTITYKAAQPTIHTISTTYYTYTTTASTASTSTSTTTQSTTITSLSTRTSTTSTTSTIPQGSDAIFYNASNNAFQISVYTSSGVMHLNASNKYIYLLPGSYQINETATSPTNVFINYTYTGGVSISNPSKPNTNLDVSGSGTIGINSCIFAEYCT